MSEKDKAAGPTTINTGGGAYIGGNATAGGNIVGRDQINVGGGQRATLEEFTRQLRELRALLGGARLDPDIRGAIDADFEVVEAQVRKPDPKRGLIEGKLQSIAGALGSADQAAGAARGLIEKGVALAAMLAAMASQVF